MFSLFSCEKFAYVCGYMFPTKIATPPLVPPRFSRSATFCDERVLVEVKIHKNLYIYYIFIYFVS